jgi:hypothetical protein
MKGIIGHTGFVGSNLCRQTHFDRTYNSKNIESIRGQEFDLLVCAGVSAEKWKANKDPQSDLAAIYSLMSHIRRVKAKRFVLISTIDVFPYNDFGPYGAHRADLEVWIENRFAHSSIVRLPALFGPGLKKNVLFDLLHDNQVDRINPDSWYQWYPVRRLWRDLRRTKGLNVVNLFPPAIPTSSIIKAFFPSTIVGGAAQPAVRYNNATSVAMPNDIEVLGEMAQFIASERALCTP